MNTPTGYSLHKILLGLSLAAFLIGFSDLFGAIPSGLGRALGAVLFILFFICYVLKDEQMDSEQPALKPVRAPLPEKSGGNVAAEIALAAKA